MKILLSLILLSTLAACSGDANDAESQIRETLEEIELAAESRNRRDISAHLSESYLDEQQYDKKSIENLLRGYLLTHQSINIFTTIRSIKIQSPTRARVELTAAMAAKNIDLSQESNRLRADLHQFTILLNDDSGKGDWKVVSAKWQQDL